MAKTLILTGWKYGDYAVAAALALRHFKVADILGMSRRRLPEYLEGISGYAEIVILGVYHPRLETLRESSGFPKWCPDGREGATSAALRTDSWNWSPWKERVKTMVKWFNYLTLMGNIAYKKTQL